MADPNKQREPGEIDQYPDGWGIVTPEVEMTPEQTQAMLRELAQKEKQS